MGREKYPTAPPYKFLDGPSRHANPTRHWEFPRPGAILIRMDEHGLIADVKKIAVLRASALGDLIFALPALDALRSAYPGAQLIYLGRKWHAEFLPGRLPGAHRVIALPPPPTLELILQGKVMDPAAEADFLRGMREEELDLAIQMQGAGRTSNPFVQSLEARVTAGMRGTDAPPLDRWLPYGYYQNEVARLLEVASLVGATPSASALQPVLNVLEGDLAEAGPWIDTANGPYVVLHPGSTDPRRCWSPEKFAAVGDFCAGQGLAVMLVGAAYDSSRVDAVARAMRSPVVNLCDQLSLSGLVGLLSRAALFVGNDSGPLHVALAVGARAVGLFWVEYIVNSMPLGRSRFSPLIAWNRTCPICGRYCEKPEIDSPSPGCAHEGSFIEEIQPEQVIAALDFKQGAG